MKAVYLKKLAYAAIYIIYLAAALIFTDYIFYCSYINRIFKLETNRRLYGCPRPVKNVEAITLSRLGYISTDKNSCFVNFAPNKKEGVIRIGCFGDSFTHGDDVNEFYDYPSLLQDIFAKNGYRNIEVINFGSRWYGFSQTFIMWKYVGRIYDLDYILLGPQGFWLERENTFSHTKGKNIYYMHARFILKDKMLKLVDVIGDAYEERAANYLRIIPPLRYLIFDVNPPAFLACLIPSNRELKKSPFYYYRGDLKTEVVEIYKLLLSEMADAGVPIILGHCSNEIVDLAASLNKTNLFSYRLDIPGRFPYITVNGHNSPYGNQLLARQMFDSLTGKGISQTDILEMKDVDKEISEQVNVKNKRLFEYGDIKIKVKDAELGCFENDFRSSTKTTPMSLIKEHRITSLLAIKRKGDNILEAIFLPLDFDISEDAVLRIGVRIGDKQEFHNVGAIRLLNPHVGIGVIESESIILNDEKRLIYNGYAKELKNPLPLLKERSVTVFLNDREVLKGNIINPKAGAELLPVKYNFFIIAAKGDSLIDTAKLGATGIVYLSLCPPNGEEVKIPFAQFIKTTKTLPLGQRRFAITKLN